jgi:prolyl-tRNA synthetase
VTRLSAYPLPTEREPPADAEAISHRLMVRAGLVRQVGAGLWSWLPAGWRVHERVEGIVREELDAIGAHEMLMPVLQPVEPWRRTGRAEIEELFKLKDRRGADLVLAMTHEEVVTLHVAQMVRSIATFRSSSTTSRSRSATSRARARASCGPASSS